MYRKSTSHSQRDYLLYLLCFLFQQSFFSPALLGETSFGFQSVTGEMRILFQAQFYLILLCPDFMSEM